MSELIEIFRPRKQVAREHREAQEERRNMDPFSRRGLIDHFKGVLHVASGGRFGRPSAAARAAALFEESVDTSSAALHSDMAAPVRRSATRRPRRLLER